MNISVVILAGGIGARMGVNIPKQFIEVDGIPIVVKTIFAFQKNQRVNGITIVCVEQYKQEMWELVKTFNLTKVTSVVTGGSTGHESTRNGVFSLKDKLSEDDFVIIHDAVRPILPQVILDDMIDTAIKYGNACLAVPCYETVVCTSNGISGNTQIDRNSFVRVQTPQMYRYGLIKELYEKAERDGLNNFVYANTLAIHYGTTIYFSKGFNYNYKITTQDDLPLYKALLNFSEEELARRK